MFRLHTKNSAHNCWDPSGSFFIEFMEVGIMEVLGKITYTHSYWTLLLPIIMMGADVLTGWIQASVNGTWDSTKMRKGLFRKSGEIVILVLAYVVQVAIALPANIYIFISIYVCIMELLSVIENLDQAGLPVPAWITRRLKKAMDTMVSGDDEPEPDPTPAEETQSEDKKKEE